MHSFAAPPHVRHGAEQYSHLVPLRKVPFGQLVRHRFCQRITPAWQLLHPSIPLPVQFKHDSWHSTISWVIVFLVHFLHLPNTSQAHSQHTKRLTIANSIFFEEMFRTLVHTFSCKHFLPCDRAFYTFICGWPETGLARGMAVYFLWFFNGSSFSASKIGTFACRNSAAAAH